MAIYYVDPDDGDDGNSGTSMSDAWQTLDHAFMSLPSGSTLYAKAGTLYKETNPTNLPNDNIEIIFDTAGDYWDYSPGDVTIDYSGLSSGAKAWAFWGSNITIKQNGGNTITMKGASGVYALAPDAPGSRVLIQTPIYFDTFDSIIYSDRGGFLFVDEISFSSINSVAYVRHPSAYVLIRKVSTDGGILSAESGVVEVVSGTFGSLKHFGGHMIVYDGGTSQATVQSTAYHIYDHVFYDDRASYYAQGYVMRSTDVSSPTGQPDVIKAVLTDMGSVNGGLIPFKWVYLPNTALPATIHIYVRPVSNTLTQDHFHIGVIYQDSGGTWHLEFSDVNTYTLNADTWTELTYTTSSAVKANVPITIWGSLFNIPSGSSQTIYVDTYLNVTF